MISETTKNKTINIGRNDCVPPEMLQQSRKAKLEYFENYSVAHTVLNETFNKLWRAVLDAKPGSIVLVYGPAGVGKTTLLDYLEKRIIEYLKPDLDTDRELIPLVKVEAKNPDNGNFSWKTLYRAMLWALSEPAVDRKLDMNRGTTCRESYRVSANKETSSDKLREVVEEALRNRRPKAVLIDEAQHMAVLSSGRKLYDQQNTIKSIANQTRTTHIIFGSYDILPFRNLNAQLARRTLDVHFRRYDHTDDEDVKIFQNVLWQFQTHLPLKQTPDMVAEWRYFYERSAGCVGVVKEWLNRALSMAFDENSESLEMHHLRSSALSVSKAMVLLDEAQNGENKLEEDDGDEKELEGRLWDSSNNKKGIKIIKKNGEIKPVRSGWQSKSVGTRNPARDAVGLRNYA